MDFGFVSSLTQYNVFATPKSILMVLSHVSSQLSQTRQCSLCLCVLSLIVKTSVLSVVYLVLCFALFFFFAFSGWFCCLKRPPGVAQKCCLVLLSPRRLWCVMWRKYACWVSFIQAWATVLLATSSVLMNQQCVLKMSLNRNGHKQGYVLISW